MNFKEVSELNPKAFDEFIKWVLINELDYSDGGLKCFFRLQHIIMEEFSEFKIPNDYPEDLQDALLDIRQLYDFFDEHKITCTVEDKFSNTIKVGDNTFWKFEKGWINLLGGATHLSSTDNKVKVYDKRTEAESELFTKAFQILENRLK